MRIKMTPLHKNPIWCDNKTAYWQTYLPTEDGRCINGRYEGKRIFDRDRDSFIFRINYFYENSVVLSKEAATNLLKSNFTSDIKYCGKLDIDSANDKSFVYEYIDKNDNLVKYVGIVNKQTLLERHNQHLYNDKWCNEKDFYIRFIVVNNRSEAEALESHLIALHKTYNYYNKAKTGWGINSLLLSYTPNWLVFSPEKCRKTLKSSKAIIGEQSCIKKERKNKLVDKNKRHMKRKCNI